MIIVKIKGGLGNQLFQYALGRHLALKNNTTLQLDTSFFKNTDHRIFELSNFNIRAEIAPEGIIPFIKRDHSFYKKVGRLSNTIFSKFKIINENQISFSPQILDCRDNAYLDGYWQSEKYFIAIKDILHEDLTFKKELSETQKTLADHITKCTSVSIHVRRGDFVGSKYHPTCDVGYYKQAIGKMLTVLQDPQFFIFSDDLEWCKENLKAPKF